MGFLLDNADRVSAIVSDRLKCRKTQRAYAGIDIQAVGRGTRSRYSRWKCTFNALHIKRRQIIWYFLFLTGGTAGCRCEWIGETSKGEFICASSALLLHIHPRRTSPRWTFPARTYERTPLSHSTRCQCNTAYLGSWKGTTLLFRNDSRSWCESQNAMEILCLAQRNSSALSVS